MPGLAIISDSTVIVPPGAQPQQDVCTCEFYCEYEEMVFASDSSDTWKSDFSSFLTKKLTASDTVTIKLFRNNVEAATITDNTYGTYYSTFAAQPLYVGFKADWTAIFNAFGGGQYYIEISSTLAGTAYTFTSRKFRLMAYDALLADNTVKIEAWQTGNILSSPFDFSDLVTGGWYQAMRVPGNLQNKVPTLEVDNYLNTSYDSIQNRSEVSFTYTLQMQGISQSVFDIFSENLCLANKLHLTNYSVFDTVILRDIELMTNSFANVEHYSNGKGSYDVEFTPKKQNTIKRNF